MKASDVQELQRKLQKLQFELKHGDEEDDPNAAQAREENYIQEKLMEAKKRELTNRKLTIEDFDIYTTLGTVQFFWPYLS